MGSDGCVRSFIQQQMSKAEFPAGYGAVYWDLDPRLVFSKVSKLQPEAEPPVGCSCKKKAGKSYRSVQGLTLEAAEQTG